MEDIENERLGFANHGLSPPLRRKKSASYNAAVKRIKRDFAELYKEIWESENDEHKFTKKILLFLYSRGFHVDTDQNQRVDFVNEMLQKGKKGKIRERMIQIVKADADVDLSSDEAVQEHYCRTCLALYRYFLQDGATGFLDDMSSLMYYFRQQKHGSCFLQAACVTMSYMLQSFGEPAAPADASNLICHTFNDEQLLRYVVHDKGGDSTAMLRLLDAMFFQCDFPSRSIHCLVCSTLEEEVFLAAAKDLVQRMPGLLSRFKVPENFGCRRKKGEEERIGYARFTEWNQLATFVPLSDPTDDAQVVKEAALQQKWKTACRASQQSTTDCIADDVTVATASLSMEEACAFDEETSSSLCEESFGEF